MARGIVMTLSLLLLAALGLAVWSVRSSAVHAQETALAAQVRKNAALSDETARLEAFLQSPLCAGGTLPAQQPPAAPQP